MSDTRKVLSLRWNYCDMLEQLQARYRLKTLFSPISLLSIVHRKSISHKHLEHLAMLEMYIISSIKRQYLWGILWAQNSCKTGIHPGLKMFPTERTHRVGQFLDSFLLMELPKCGTERKFGGAACWCKELPPYSKNLLRLLTASPGLWTGLPVYPASLAADKAPVQKRQEVGGESPRLAQVAKRQWFEIHTPPHVAPKLHIKHFSFQTHGVGDKTFVLRRNNYPMNMRPSPSPQKCE